MTEHRALVGIAIAVSALAFAGAAGSQQPKPKPPPSAAPQCFRPSDWQGWKATKDGASMYISTGINRTYRLDFRQACPELNQIDAKLITRSDSSWICHPIDVNIRVAYGPGMVSACQVGRITRLTPAQIKALPRALRP